MQGRLILKDYEACFTPKLLKEHNNQTTITLCAQLVQGNTKYPMQIKQNCFQDKNKNCNGFPYNYARGRLNFKASEAYSVLKHATIKQTMLIFGLVRSLFTFEQSETKFTLLL